MRRPLCARRHLNRPLLRASSGWGVALLLAAALTGCSGGPPSALSGRLPGNALGGESPPIGGTASETDPAAAQFAALLAGLEGRMPQRPGDLPRQWQPSASQGAGASSSGARTQGDTIALANFASSLRQQSAETLTPRNDRDWIPEHQTLARAELRGDQLKIYNVRDAEFFSYRDCIVEFHDKTYRLSDLQTVDFVVVPFTGAEALAHTMLTFGFAGGEHLGVSVEVRLEKGESYHPVAGLLKQFEIIYVVAEERDLIRVRTEHRDCDVFVYRSTATPAHARALLLDILDRVNQLHDQPEFYDTLSNNCTTNIVRHINRLAPERVPYDYRVLLPGFADHLAYELGLIDNRRPFAELKQAARVNELALRHRDSPNFSAKIRGDTILR